MLGAPKLDGGTLAARLNHRGIEAATAPARIMTSMPTLESVPSLAPAARAAWRAAYFVPTWWKFNGSNCGGVQLVRAARGATFAQAADLLVGLREMAAGKRLVWDGSWFGTPGPQLVDEYAGTSRLRELLDGGASAAELVAAFADEAASFAQQRRRFLLYD